MSPDGPKIASPEEKLLRLIREKGPGAPSARLTPAEAAVPSPAHPATFASRLAERVGRGWRFPSWGLTAINIGLGVALLAEVIGWVVVMTRGKPTGELAIEPPEVPVAEALPTPAPPSSGPGTAAASPSPSLTSVASRPFFQSDMRQGAGGSSPRATGAPSDEAKALAARLSLIGIVAGEPPQAIIEDAQTKKTFFATAGQALIEGLLVEEIRENRVVLDLRGEKIELSL